MIIYGLRQFSHLNLWVRIYTNTNFPTTVSDILEPIHNIPDDMRDIPANSGGDVRNGAKPAALWPAEVIGGVI